MDIRSFIDKNGKLILKVVLLIIFVLFAIKSLNSFYEKEEEMKQQQIIEEQTKKEQEGEDIQIDYTTESPSTKKTISSFINYCNTKELENAYMMLTDECKEVMFPTLEKFKERYINNIFDIERIYKIEKWSTKGDMSTYLITLYPNILATGNTENYTQDYYTLLKNKDGNYKININSYICRKNKNIETTVKNVTVKIEHVDVYEEYEVAKITITNNTGKTICLTENKYKENIYLQNSRGVKYVSLNSEFDEEFLQLQPNVTKTFTVEFNKIYNPNNEATQLVLSDVIFDYETYVNIINNETYSNRTSIKIKY